MSLSPPSFVDDIEMVYGGGGMKLTNNLDLDVDLNQVLRERVDLDETGVDGARETAKLGDKSYITLADGLIRVGTAETARNGTESSNARPKAVDHGPIPAVLGFIFRIRLDDLRIRWLQIFATWRLDFDQRILDWRALASRARHVVVSGLCGAGSAVGGHVVFCLFGKWLLLIKANNPIVQCASVDGSLGGIVSL